MKSLIPLAVMAVELVFVARAFGQSAEPTKSEIASAYRSKAGEGGTPIPGLRWEKRRVNRIRGWSLKFKRLHQDETLGILTRRYHALASKNGACAEYQIIDTVPLTRGIPHMKPSLNVEPSGVRPCR